MLLPLLAAVLLVNTAPLFADENNDYYSTDKQPNITTRKDECLLVAMNCVEQPFSGQEKVERIQNEINKGTAVYTTEELKVLDKLLRDTIEEQRLMMQE
jgi:anti-sigma28 factor (negative regulator of flagellin synthesis)